MIPVAPRTRLFIPGGHVCHRPVRTVGAVTYNLRRHYLQILKIVGYSIWRLLVSKLGRSKSGSTCKPARALQVGVYYVSQLGRNLRDPNKNSRLPLLGIAI